MCGTMGWFGGGDTLHRLSVAVPQTRSPSAVILVAGMVALDACDCTYFMLAKDGTRATVRPMTV